MAKGETSCHRHRRSLPNHHTWAQRKIKWFRNQGWWKHHCIRCQGFQASVFGCSTPLGGHLCMRTHFLRDVWSFSEVLKWVTEGMRGVSHRREWTNTGELLKNRARNLHDILSNHSKTMPWDSASLLPVSCVYLAAFTPPPKILIEVNEVTYFIKWKIF